MVGTGNGTDTSAQSTKPVLLDSDFGVWSVWRILDFGFWVWRLAFGIWLWHLALALAFGIWHLVLYWHRWWYWDFDLALALHYSLEWELEFQSNGIGMDLRVRDEVTINQLVNARSFFVR